MYRFKKIERKACRKKLSHSRIYNIEDAEESCLRETNCKGVSWNWVGEEFHLCQVGYDYIDGVDYVHDKFRKSIFGLKFLSFIYHQIFFASESPFLDFRIEFGLSLGECKVNGKSGDGTTRGSCEIGHTCHPDGTCILRGLYFLSKQDMYQRIGSLS